MIKIAASSDHQFERVVRDCYDDVYRFACSLTNADADAADLTQQAFLRYARKGGQLRDQGKVKSWLFSVLRNEFTDIQRRKTRFPHQQLTPEQREVHDSAPLDERADWETALEALRSLPTTFREPLALYYLEGYTYREIAEVMELPIGTVMSRLSRGKARLQALMAGTPKSRTRS